jgi:hypothetical protein
VSSICASPTINPPEPVLKRPERMTVVIHAFTPSRIRPAPDPPFPDPPAQEGRRTGRRRQGDTGRHHLDESSWLDVAERVLHAWPITARLAVLTVVLATGTAMMAALVGVACQLALAGLGVRARIRGRRRVHALQARRRALLEHPGAHSSAHPGETRHGAG